MGLPQPVKRYTPREYYALEREAEYRSDYYNGQIFAMAGGTSRHSDIILNICGELRNRLKGRPCRPKESNQRLKVAATGLRFYPDVSVFCGPLEYDTEDLDMPETAVNPTMLFEVLSPSTESYDRGFKSENFRMIATLKSYVLVAQDKPHVEMYERQANDHWLFSEVKGLEGNLELPAIGVSLPLAEIYEAVEFTQEPRPPLGMV
jgi:Uma2 family endonuclease